MSRPPNIERSISTNLHLPESVRTRIDLLLYSAVEERIPKGAYQRFFLALVQEFFIHKSLDVSVALGLPAGTCIVKGRPETLAQLEAYLIQSQP